MVTQFLGNTIVSIATVFSGMWVFFKFWNGGLIFSCDYWAYWELQLCKVQLDYCKYPFSI